MDYTIREIEKSEYRLLEDFLYEAIFIPEEMSSPEKSIINQPDLQVYVEDFGAKQDDYCLIAEIDGRIVGAAWTRIMKDYGHVDDETPSLAISIFKKYRGLGIGTELLKQLLLILKSNGYKKTSLSVQKANYAFKMYQNLGYKILYENEEEYIMINHLNN